MKSILENLLKYNFDIVKALEDILGKSADEIQQKINALSADDYINLVAALDKDDIDRVDELLSAVEGESTAELALDQTKKRIKQLDRNKDIDWDVKQKQILELIANLKSNEWDLVWPDLDKDLLRKLYNAAFDKDLETISGDQTREIWTWTKDNIMEKVIYQDQIVEVKVSQGPNNTVGIILDEKVVMVPRRDIKRLNEHVMGNMTQMPSIARLQALAGVSGGVAEDQLVPPNSRPTSDEKLDKQYAKYQQLVLGGMDPDEAEALAFDDEDEDIDENKTSESKVVVDFDPANPMDNTRVILLGGAGSLPLKDLRNKIRRESRELAADLSSDAADYRSAAHNIKQLANSLNTMVAALEEIGAIRRSGQRTRNIEKST